MRNLMTCAAIVILLILAAIPARAQDKLTFYGDFRGRVELDRASDQPDGTKRTDRDRLRVRGRLGLNYAASEHVAVGMRLRTGHPESIQSPHITLGDGFSEKAILLDRVFGQVRYEGLTAWMGKNSNPFWHANELFWDDDVTMEGVAAMYRLNEHVEVRGGYFVLDSPQSNTFSDQAKMVGGQMIIYRGPLTGAVAIRSIQENPDSEDQRLADLNFLIISGNLYGSFSVSNHPVRLGIDVASNQEDYDAGFFNHDQTLAYVASVQFGSTKESRDWQFGYYYAHVQKYAIVAAFAQDDWVRWGSNTSTRSSNFGGHEFRIVYTLNPRQNLMARVFVVEGLEKESSGATALETGTRFRLDWNISF